MRIEETQPGPEGVRRPQEASPTSEIRRTEDHEARPKEDRVGTNRRFMSPERADAGADARNERFAATARKLEPDNDTSGQRAAQTRQDRVELSEAGLERLGEEADGGERTGDVE